jgi:LppP/LprE lipoprotein
MRFLGLLATAALLAVGATAALTVIPDANTPDAALPEAAPASTPAPAKAAKKHKKAKPKLTATQRQERAAAVTTLSDQGYRPVTLRDYAPTHLLRVMVGKGDGGQRAFFFAKGRYIGNDAADDSARVQVVRAGNRSVALSYKLFRPGDKPCCPKGAATRVLFRWDGKKLTPMTAIPPVTQRHAPA